MLPLAVFTSMAFPLSSTSMHQLITRTTFTALAAPPALAKRALSSHLQLPNNRRQSADLPHAQV
jgi:hypothetical protein